MKTAFVFAILLLNLAGLASESVADTTEPNGTLVTNLTGVVRYVEKFAQKIELDIPMPLATNQVTQFIPYRGHADVAGLTILGRFQFVFDVRHHFVNTFYDRQDSMVVLWRAENIKPLIQSSKLTKEQALEMARKCLVRLGYSEKDLPLLPPTVNQWKWQPPGAEKPEMLPFFTVEWPWSKYPDWKYFTIEIDGFREKVTHFSTIYPRQDPPALK